MSIDPVVLSSVTAAVSTISAEYFKGFASEAAKSSWSRVKTLLGMTADPTPEEIPQKVERALAASPQIAADLLHLLQNNPTVAPLVRNLSVTGGNVVVAQNIGTLNIG
jgi:hypothetical protein